MFEIFTLGEEEFLREVLFAVVALMDIDSGIASGYFIMSGFLVGVIITAIKGAVTGKYEPQVFMLSLVAYLIFFIPRVDVVVTSIHTGSSSTVDDVPIGIAAPGSIISSIGMKLAERFEQAFSTPTMADDNGYLQPLRAIMVVRDSNAKSTFSNLPGAPTGSFVDWSQSFSNYIEDCVVKDIEMDLVDREISLSQLQREEDVWANLSVTADMWTTTLFLDATAQRGVVYNCTEAYALLDALANDSAFQAGLTDAHLQGTPYTSANIDSFLAQISSNTMSAYRFMLSGYLKYHFDQVRAGNDGMTSSLIQFQAMEQRRVNNAAQRSLFEEIATPLATFVEVLFYFLAPIMAFLITLGSFGVSMIGKYLVFLIWVNTWPITMSVINLYTWLSVEKDMNGINSVLPPTSWTGMEQLYTTGATWISISSMLAASVPLITLMLLTGSATAFTSMVNRMSSGGEVDGKLAAPDITKGANSGKVSIGDKDLAVNTRNVGQTLQSTREMTAPGNLEFSTGQATSRSLSHDIGVATTNAARSASAIESNISNIRSIATGHGTSVNANTTQSSVFERSAQDQNALQQAISNNSTLSRDSINARGAKVAAGLFFTGSGAGLSSEASEARRKQQLESLGLSDTKEHREILARAERSSVDYSKGFSNDERSSLADSVGSLDKTTTAYEESQQRVSQLKESLARNNDFKTGSRISAHDVAQRGADNWYRSLVNEKGVDGFSALTRDSSGQIKHNYAGLEGRALAQKVYADQLMERYSEGDAKGVAELLRHSPEYVDEAQEIEKRLSMVRDTSLSVDEGPHAVQQKVETAIEKAPALNQDAINNAGNAVEGALDRVNKNTTQKTVTAALKNDGEQLKAEKESRTSQVKSPGLTEAQQKRIESIDSISAENAGKTAVSDTKKMDSNVARGNLDVATAGAESVENAMGNVLRNPDAKVPSVDNNAMPDGINFHSTLTPQERVDNPTPASGSPTNAAQPRNENDFSDVPNWEVEYAGQESYESDRPTADDWEGYDNDPNKRE